MTPLPQLLEEAEQSLAERAKALHKAAERIKKCRDELTRGNHGTPLLQGLAEDLARLPREPAEPDWDALSGALTRHQHDSAARTQREFPTGLRDAAEATGLAFRGSGDRLTVGPFAVRVDFAKRTAALEYAKHDVAKDVPLNPGEVVAQAKQLADDLLAPLADPRVFAQQLEEAMRVVIARQKKSLAAGDLRAELPGVYREMLYLRQGWSNPTAKRKLTEYPLARFVVEVKTFLQSNENLDADRPFRLEPAVIENTRNTSKSLYFPTDLSDGSGEGMYFQALLLKQSR